jgi:hypothetical protein
MNLKPNGNKKDAVEVYDSSTSLKVTAPITIGAMKN